MEAGVQLVQRWILAALRHRTFFSLTKVNEAMAGLLARLNAKPFRKVSESAPCVHSPSSIADGVHSSKDGADKVTVAVPTVKLRNGEAT